MTWAAGPSAVFLLTALSCAATVGSALSARPSPGPADPAERRLLELLNAERSARDLPEVRWNPSLADLARGHAADLVRSGELSHLSTGDGATYANRLAGAELRALAAAENLARGRGADHAHAGLMDSPGHRAAILNPELEEVGIGVARPAGGGTLYVVQDFATFMPGFSDREAGEALVAALEEAWLQAGGPRPEEDTGLSGKLAAAVVEMVVADSIDSGLVRAPGPAWVFAYTATDPAVLPAGVRARAGKIRRYGVAVSFRRTPSAPLGLYWVALALTEPVEKP
jgi:uncharacterized protein YkwD